MNKVIYLSILMLFLAACNGTVENTVVVQPPVINPPFEGIDVPLDTFQIDPTVENTIETKKGTVIHIPANILVDKKGQPVTDQIDLYYRSFHSAAEIIASGIPMTYDSVGTSYDFVSAGMFELKAYQNTNEVFIKNGAEIDMEFASADNHPGFNLYTLDENTGDWTFEETSSPIQNTRKQEKIEQFRADFIMTLDVDYQMYPELKIFNDLKWIYHGPENSADNPKTNPWLFEEKWREVKLSKSDEVKGVYSMQLKSKNKTIELQVSPYIEGDEETFLAALDEGILKQNAYVKQRKEEELTLQLQADMVRKFSISNFGICNVDSINRLIDSGDLFVTNARFMIKNKLKTEEGKIVLISGNDKIMRIREDVMWEQMQVNPKENNSLMVILPHNEVAICRQSEFDKANGNSTYDFQFAEYIKIDSFEAIEELIDQL